jgi:hypothetical protein
MSKSQKWLLAWSVVGLALAEWIKHLPMETRTTTIVGGVELVLAIATGIAFGISTVRKTPE